MNLRQGMIDEIKERYNLDSPSVFSAMLQVPREEFASGVDRGIVYRDGPIDIGNGQTMSQPYTVAFMTHLLTEKRDTRNEKILEIGTGSGYQAAVLSHLVRKVYTVEIVKILANKAQKRLKRLGYKNVYVKHASGEFGWEEHAPYDAVLVTAGIEDKVPKALFNQLKVGGVLVAPVGKGVDKQMIKYEKRKNEKTKKREYGIFHFVPFVEKEISR